MKTIEIIEKEKIPELNFSRKEVLLDPEERKRRFSDLHRSQTLGNLLQSKVKITFEANEDATYQVITTVWAVGSDFISLKGGVTLPINSIVKID